MDVLTGQNRVFLFLQGPHGPFFAQLGRAIRQTEAQVWRVGFNAGDDAFWPDRKSYVPYLGTVEDWPDFLRDLLNDKGITDLVLYGDTRPIHEHAVHCARQAGLRIHVFEEGYMRPYWVTYERDGSNGNSKLMQLSIDEMKLLLDASNPDAPMPSSSWGDMREHIFYGAIYHGLILLNNRKYKTFRPHRAISISKEFKLYLRRLMLMPAQSIERRLATWRVTKGGFPYHMALLQLEHDASFKKHSPFSTTSEFLEVLFEGFSQGAPQHHHLVIKAHPLEDGRVPIRKDVWNLARKFGIEHRVHYVRGGKLAHLLDNASSAVTVNSTAGQQVLWRGIPLKTVGRAVYSKPELISAQHMAEFFTSPHKPDHDAYSVYRRFLLATSQVSGGFYSARGRRQLLRQVVDHMLAAHDPYEKMYALRSEPQTPLRVVN